MKSNPNCQHKRVSTGRVNRGTIKYCMDCGKVLERKILSRSTRHDEWR